MRMNIVSRADKVDITVSAVVVGNRLAGLDISVYLHVVVKRGEAIPRNRPVERPCRSSQVSGIWGIKRNSPVGCDNDGHPRSRIDVDILRRRRIRHTLRLGNRQAFLHLARIDAVPVGLCYFPGFRDNDTGAIREHDALVAIEIQVFPIPTLMRQIFRKRLSRP